MQYRMKKFSFLSSASDQGGIGPAFNWFRGTPYLDMTEAFFRSYAVGANLGEGFETEGLPQNGGGNTYAFFKAKAGLTEGQVIAMEAPTTGTVTNNAGQSTIYSVLTNINNAATVAANGDVDNWICVLATGATLLQLRRIKSNTSSTTARYVVSDYNYLLPNTPHDQDAFDTLATNADVCSIIRPYNVIVNTAATVPIGIALGTVTAGNYTIALVKGLAAVSAIGSGTALAVNSPAVGSSAGVIIGMANDTTAQPSPAKFNAAASIVPMMAYAGSGALIPCMVNFIGQ